MLLGILKQKGRLADAARTLDADHTVAPVDLVHEGTAYWGIRMLYKISMRPEKCFHFCLICFLTFKSGAKVTLFSQIAKSK
jgi:hypothetical protein